MSDSTQSQPPPLESRRVPLEREVVLEFEQFASFIREYSANISLGGMFIKTEKPHLPEREFRFEIRLADDAPLIAGLAKVLWVREVADGADRPAGMGVGFLKLEDKGLGLIEQIVREHTARGGRPFHFEDDVEPPADLPAAEAGASQKKPVPLDRSAVIELPALEELLQEARSPNSTVTLDTPPRGWKPGIRVARPRTRPQLIGLIAVAAAILGMGIFFLTRLFSSSPVLDAAETEPIELPQVEAEADVEQPLPPFTTIEEITWRRAGNGAEILVRLDGSLPEGAWSVERMSDPPRHVLRLVGPGRPYPTETLEVGFGGVRQLRTGFHESGASNEQHVVVDLVDPRVALEESEVEGPLVRLRFRRLNP
jgi:type IV pilus assembly protein PilZ